MALQFISRRGNLGRELCRPWKQVQVVQLGNSGVPGSQYNLEESVWALNVHVLLALQNPHPIRRKTRTDPKE